jgi:hypothetical protein
MKRFLRNLASSVIRPQPSLHPFAESIYPATRAAAHHSAESSEIVVGISRPQPSLPQPVPPVQTRELLPFGSLQSEQHEELVTSLRENHAASEQAKYQPLLPVREMKSSVADVVGMLSRRREADSHDERESASGRPRGEERGVAAVVPEAKNSPERHEVRPTTQVVPLVPQFDAQALRSPRRPVAAAQFISRHQQETRSDEVRINIGRIEVTAVPPAPARATPVPPRKGLSLDEYLNRRNGRLG